MASWRNLVSIARETIEITAEKRYQIGEEVYSFPEMDYEKVIVCSPEDGQKLLSEDDSAFRPSDPCRIIIENCDSFESARKLENSLVMNFANAHVAGGGFLGGAVAQEEALCRCSTLYASISSEPAKEMYHYNNTHASAVESDYMLLSPEVCVFRTADCQLTADTFTTAVITIPAPNRRGAGFFASKKQIEETFLRRIRIMLRLSAKYGYQSLVLGAWGCGAFGNNPEDVAEYFRKVLIDEGYGRYFETVCFAVLGNPQGKNYQAFEKMVQSIERK